MPEYDEYTAQNRSWTRLFILFSLLLLLGVLIWAVFFRASQPTPKTSRSTTTTTQSPAPSSQNVTPNSSPGSGTSQPSNQPAATSNTPTPQTGTLANTGPGSMVSIFIGASLTGVLIARSYLKRAAGNADSDVRS